MRWRITFLLVVWISWSSCQKEQKSSDQMPIIDQSGILSDSEEESLLSLIQEAEKATKSQISIVIVDSLKGETINEFSLRTAMEMSPVKNKLEYGLLIAVVFREHTVRIEVSDGLEKIIKDEIAAKVIRD